LRPPGMRLRGRGLFGFGGGREAVVVVVVDGVVDGFAPSIGAEGFAIFVLGVVDSLHESLGEIGDSVGGSGLDITADNSGDESRQGGTEIAGGKVVAGEEVGEVFTECFGGANSGFFLGVVEAEVRMVGGARSAATAAIGERKRTQGHAVLGTESRHKSLLRLSFGNCGPKAGRAEARPYTGKQAVENRNAPTESGRSLLQGYCTTRIRRGKWKIRGRGKKSQRPQP